MNRSIDRHLDPTELALLTGSTSQDASEATHVDESGMVEVRRHLDACSDCRERATMYEFLKSKIRSDSGPGSDVRGPDCADDQQWMRLTGSMLAPEQSRILIRHAAECEHCGPKLRDAVENLSEESSEVEKQVMARLQSSSTQWRREMSRRLQDQLEPRLSKQPYFWWPRLVTVVSITAVLIAFCWTGIVTFRNPSLNKLLAQAYTERRTVETRFPGATYAPLRVERGPRDSNLDKPAALLRAETLISEQLRSQPDNPLLLQAKARADLLDGNYDAAIQSLEHAIDESPGNPDLLADLGSAYYVRAATTDHALDYGLALDVLAKALKAKPDDPVILFNHALTCERLFLFSEAKDDWIRYLRLDSTSGWSQEAREHLDTVERNIEQQLHNQTEPLLTPEQIVGGTQDERLGDRIDLRVEDYMHAAVTDWLPSAFPLVTSSANTETEKAAIHYLAVLLEQRHRDTWLRDLLAASGAREFAPALREMSNAVRFDDRGDYSSAQDSAARSAWLFHLAGNSAGELRATAEAIYSDQLLWEGTRCVQRLQKVRPILQRTSYGWLRGQIALEESNCANLTGNLGEYQGAIGAGIREAQDHKYIPLYLRGLGFQALSAASFGDDATDFDLAFQGLASFWSHSVDVMKGYNLYYDLDSAADQMELRDLQVDLWREAVTLIDQHPDILQRAMAHRWSGKAALSAGDSKMAETEFMKASDLFAQAPRSAATARDFLDAEIWLATAEVQQAELVRAATRLDALKPSLSASPSFDPEIGFYTAEADLALREGDMASAETALRPAIYLSEWALDSIKSETSRREWSEQTRTTYLDAVRWKLRQGDPKSALELWEWYRGADVRVNEHRPNRAIALPLPDVQTAGTLPNPDEVARTIPFFGDRSVVAYASFSDGVAAWIYDDRGVNFHWIQIPQEELRARIRRFTRLCADSTSDLNTLRSTGRQLYDLLIRPVGDDWSASRYLVFEPDSDLASLPWVALVDPRGHYLAERSAIVVSPGLYRTRHLRQTFPISKVSTALVVSVPTIPSERLPPLADASEEARNVSAFFNTPRELFGTAATLRAVREQLSGTALFHFAGHAVASPQRTGLLLDALDPKSQRVELLSPASLSGSDLGSLQLAVLSACDTADQYQHSGPAAQELTEFLLSSGVPHIVASLWNVDSRQTTHFMSEFYGQLFDGRTVADSVHAAQLTLLHRPESSHPFYWAAFELQGAA